MIPGCQRGSRCPCDAARAALCPLAPVAPSPDATTEAERVAASRAFREQWRKDVRAGRALPAAGDLFDVPEAGILPGLPLFDPDERG